MVVYEQIINIYSPTLPNCTSDSGIFGLGNPAADLLALRWVKKREGQPEPFVIHGVYIDAMAAAAR